MMPTVFRLVSNFEPCARSLRLQDGPFCVFPTDFSIGEGETAFVNVEYLPSEVGHHQARFVMVQVRHE